MRVAQLGAGRIGAMHAEILSSILEPGSLLVADMDPSRARAGSVVAPGETKVEGVDAPSSPVTPDATHDV
ncbi:hypothetical protein BH23CHL9_BH23CHL9_15060 [soil metagenome]